MTRKVFDELNDMMTEHNVKWVFNDDDVIRATTIRHLKERFNK